MDGQINCGPAGRPLPLQKKQKIQKIQKTPSDSHPQPHTGEKKRRGGFKTRPYHAWLTKLPLCQRHRPYDTTFLNRSVRIFSPLDSGLWPAEALTLARRSLVGG